MAKEKKALVLNHRDRAYAENFVRAAAARFGSEVEEVRVFGSRARGDFHPNSDLDLFVKRKHSRLHYFRESRG